MDSPLRPVVIGAGPAGLTAGLKLSERGRRPVIIEAEEHVGGISRTVERDGWRFDLGGHRFFTKVPSVKELWHELLPDGDLMRRPRLSRIYYDGKFYDYPLRATNALNNLGLVESARCVLSYVRSQLESTDEDCSFEAWVSSRFGRRLYRMFFKTYTEKVWGVPADTLGADWAAQRIKSLSLGAAVVDSLGLRRGRQQVTSLIEEFLYPRLGPGMMWEACRDRALAHGAELHLGDGVRSVRHRGGSALEVETGHGEVVACNSVISSMPLGSLVAAMSPTPKADVLVSAASLRHRDFLTVALVVPEAAGFPDNWIYIHGPDVRLGRVQNFGAWSPDMVKPGFTCLGLEYFVNAGDDLWTMGDDDLITFAAVELASIGLLDTGVVQRGFVTRVPKAYPVYDADYHRHVAALRSWLADHAANVHPVGRNGMHRYNNQDHSMLTAMLAVENILDGADHDLWSVNVEEEYHEQSNQTPGGWGGRDAPLTA